MSANRTAKIDRPMTFGYGIDATASVCKNQRCETRSASHATGPAVTTCLVGHPLENDEFIYVASLGVQAEATPAERNDAWNEVEAVIAQMQHNVAGSGLSSEQIGREVLERVARWGRKGEDDRTVVIVRSVSA